MQLMIIIKQKCAKNTDTDTNITAVVDEVMDTNTEVMLYLSNLSLPLLHVSSIIVQQVTPELILLVAMEVTRSFDVCV